MKLKCETILDIYTHKNTKILCQIKVHPSKDNKQQNREWENTCRSITQEQWDSFDKELKNIFEVIRGKREVACNEEIISTFGIKPNIEVKVKKSKLSSTNFYNFLGADDDCVSDSGKAEDSTDNIKNFKQIVYVLEFIWNVKPQPPSITSVIATQKYQPKKRSISTDNTFNKPLSYASYTSSEKKHRVKSLEEETQKYAPNPETSPDNIRNRPLSYKPYTPFLKNYQTNSLEKDTQEYEPNPRTSPDNICKSPLSYEPYTPSKKKYRANSLDGIKTPGVDFLQHDQFEDEYLPKPINNTTTTTIKIPPYKPAPIKETRSSKDSQSSNQSSNKEEVIDETDEELLSQSKGKTIRSKLFKKKSKHGLPKSQEIIETTSLPPTPIEDKTAIKKDSQDDDKSSKLKDVPTTTQLPKPSKKENYKSSQNEVKEKFSSKESNRDKVRKILERKESNSSTDDDFDKPRIINDNNKGLKSAPGANTENKESDVTPPKHKTTKHKHKSSHDDMAQLRRSGRSPVKPKRLIEENVSKDKHKKKIKTQKCSPSNKELFGTDDDDDDDGDDKGDDNNNDDTKQKPAILQTPKCENRKKSPSSSSSSSTKKKRKRDKSSECEQEKRDIKTWLCKKKSSSNSDTATTSKENSKSSKKGTSSKDTKKSHSKSRSKSKSPQPAEFVMPSKEEMENIRIKTKLQQEQNEMLKAELDKISVPPPREVETLSLKDMTVEDLLDTFSDHKIILDEIYKNNYKKDHIKGHDGINHCFVIRLMEQNTQLKMLQKLTDVYSNSKSTTQATLYANAMLPEWIVRIYMEKYNFNRVEAIQQIKAQDEYQLHIDEQSDNSFAFD